MIAYNIDWLDALLTKDAASKWHEKGLLSDEKWELIKAQNPSNFYSPNIFVRIGLAIFTVILLMASAGMVALVLSPDSEWAFSAFGIICGMACMVFLELQIIRNGRHRASGIDDMMLYSSVWAILLSVFVLFPYNTPMLVYYFIAWPFLVFGTIRYLDRLMALAAYLCSLGIVLQIVEEIPGVALYLMPFTGMLFSAGMYFFSKKGQNRYEWRHWHGVLTVLEILSLVTFYISGNYWVVQQVGAELFLLESVPLGWFFWLFTFTVPFLYILIGLRQKDRHMLDLGLACVAASVFSFRYYHHVMPLTWAAVISGAVLFVTAYFSIRYLRKTEGAYTYEEDTDTSLLQEVEQQLIEQTIVNQPGPRPDKSASFGGGQFGGGGAGSDF